MWSEIWEGNVEDSYIMDGYAPLVKTTASGTYYYHCDHLGTPILVTDEYGGVVWRGEYEPFGKVTAQVSAIDQPIRFPGQLEDYETGLHYNYHRYYDAGVGRYFRADPLINRDGKSSYIYAMNRTTLEIDESGLYSEYKYSGLLKGGLLAFKVWGRYCGPGWCGDDWVKESNYPKYLAMKNAVPMPPKDSADKCCMEHDSCLGGWDTTTGGKSARGKQDHSVCDPEMLRCLENIDQCNNWPRRYGSKNSPKVKAWRRAIFDMYNTFYYITPIMYHYENPTEPNKPYLWGKYGNIGCIECK